MDQMNAIVMHEFGGPEVLRYERFPKPVPGPGEVVVEVHAVSVNRTLDLVVRAGAYGAPVKLPHILGVDPSGVVSAVGEGVAGRSVGDRVVALPWRSKPAGPLDAVGMQHLGGYAEYVKLPAQATVAIPDGLDFATATVVTRHAPQAFNLLRDRAGLKAGETVLVMGASGGLGSAGVQVAKLLGATVIAGAGAPDRVQAARGLGADHGIDYRAEDLTARVLELTGGRGVDVVFENIGDPVLFPKAFHAIARHGRLVTAGSHGGGEVTLDVKRLYLYQIAVMGSLGFTDADVMASLEAAARGDFRVLIDAILPLSRAAEAHERVAGRDGVGKILLSPKLMG
ncbi:zinc-binding dehydrogenase [Sphingomonas canadensis]|uniref:Zinc-binding dehydrogenase n=1 Tax=Sphingomonas canadensis TaxID=1219257 RepID=A0ABW3HB28_9SPHN|nr:zinc-binding dehydrogenase [Sphingomonas canadensis]MCW3838323.1 zinc-binding dehydrogenase [Sphingomonas canadensis]